MCEAYDEVMDFLGEESDQQSAVAGFPICDSLEKRASMKWLGIKGVEPKGTPMIAVRATMASSLKCLCSQKISFGMRNDHKTWTRVLICRVTLDYHVLGLGDEFTVMCIHVHNTLGSAKCKQNKQKKFYDWFAYLLETYKVHVVCGDFNMLMVPTFEQCRSRGFHVDLAAWNAFRIFPGGEPACDSCAAFFVNVPGSYTLAKGHRHEAVSYTHLTLPTIRSV